MDAMKVIYGAISLIIGLILLPVVAVFITSAKNNNSTGEIAGLTSVLDLVGYGFAFGLVGIGIGMIVIGFRGG